jgi:hypothetical protein
MFDIELLQIRAAPAIDYREFPGLPAGMTIGFQRRDVRFTPGAALGIRLAHGAPRGRGALALRRAAKPARATAFDRV